MKDDEDIKPKAINFDEEPISKKLKSQWIYHFIRSMMTNHIKTFHNPNKPPYNKIVSRFRFRNSSQLPKSKSISFYRI
jgi:hypothetical protein